MLSIILVRLGCRQGLIHKRCSGQAHWTRVLHPIIKYYRYLPDRTDEYGIRKVAEYHTMEDAVSRKTTEELHVYF